MSKTRASLLACFVLGLVHCGGGSTDSVSSHSQEQSHAAEKIAGNAEPGGPAVETCPVGLEVIRTPPPGGAAPGDLTARFETKSGEELIYRGPPGYAGKTVLNLVVDDAPAGKDAVRYTLSSPGWKDASGTISHECGPHPVFRNEIVTLEPAP